MKMNTKNKSMNANTTAGQVVKKVLVAALLATGCSTAMAFNDPPAPLNIAPEVKLIAVASNGASPAVIQLEAQASDSDGSVVSVEFYSGTTMIGSTSQAPYALTWNQVAAGTYAVAAKATDNLGKATVSVATSVTVGSSASRAYYTHSDQIDTVRLISNSLTQAVWQSDLEPFGLNLPNDNPTGLGLFTFNNRFPGQYYDVETNTAYNYHRDYDPQTGRYVQSDPIGLGGGINTYSYVSSNPISATDPEGLAATAVARVARVSFEIGTAIYPYIAIPLANAIDIVVGEPAAATNHEDATGNPATDRQNPAVARQMEYEQAKNFCDRGPPTGGDQCSNLSKAIDHAENCINLYERWDNKWVKAHQQKIATWRNRIRNLKDEHNKKCAQECKPGK